MSRSVLRSVLLCDVGPRDGFQYEDTFIPTDLKVDIISGLARAGLPRIQVASFVHSKRVPQMADAEAVVARLPDVDGVRYSGLALNERGVERAHAAGLRAVDLSIATWDEHSLENANMTVAEAAAEAVRMIDRAKGFGMEVQLGLQTVFGFRSPGDTPVARIVDLVRRFGEMDLESISLADTTGMANPLLIAERIEAVREVDGTLPIVLHLHDTRGLGMANVYEALRQGVDRFDTSLAGMGGCPFIRGAAGNVATEDVVYLLCALGISSGVEMAAVAACSRKIATFLGKAFPGRMYSIV